MSVQSQTAQKAGASLSLKYFQRYQQSQQLRDKDRVFYIEGSRDFIQAMDQGCVFRALLISKKLMVVPVVQKLVRELKRKEVAYLTVSPEEFRSVAVLDRASGIGAIVEQPKTRLKDLPLDQGLCWVCLDHIRSAGNLGTLIRSAEGVGASGFLLLSDRIDPYDPAVLRASVGAFFHQPFLKVSPKELQAWVTQNQALVLGADPDVERPYYGLEKTDKPIILMLGEERKGLSESQRDLCNEMVHIPMQGQADSLNVSVAGTLLLYELARVQNQWV